MRNATAGASLRKKWVEICKKLGLVENARCDESGHRTTRFSLCHSDRADDSVVRGLQGLHQFLALCLKPLIDVVGSQSLDDRGLGTRKDEVKYVPVNSNVPQSSAVSFRVPVPANLSAKFLMEFDGTLANLALRSQIGHQRIQQMFLVHDGGDVSGHDTKLLTEASEWNHDIRNSVGVDTWTASEWITKRCVYLIR